MYTNVLTDDQSEGVDNPFAISFDDEFSTAANSSPSVPSRLPGNRESENESESDDGSDDGAAEQSRLFDPTVPRSQSGSPKKPANAPLDPERPKTGMCFPSLEESTHFVYEYERRRGYKWIRKSNIRTPEGV
jgi:hypothetical protein